MALGKGLFSKQALEATFAHGFSSCRAASTGVLPLGGRLHNTRLVWRLITKNKFVLNVIDSGYKIRWKNERPRTPCNSNDPPTSEDSKKILDHKVKAMLEKNVIRIADLRIPGAISGFFARPKKGGKFRPFISMKFTNKFIEYQKFRMTTTEFVKSSVRRKYFFTSIDCSDAYSAIPLEEQKVKYT